jgi:hypothetical protein
MTSDARRNSSSAAAPPGKTKRPIDETEDLDVGQFSSKFDFNSKIFLLLQTLCKKSKPTQQDGGT